MKRILYHIVLLATLPMVFREYFQESTGRQYGIGLRQKILLVRTFIRNNKRIFGASSWREHLLIATQIMRVPKEISGCVVECGSFKGSSAANLSLVCKLCDRHLHVFDSFCGIPEPAQDEEDRYESGMYAGTLDEVGANISQYGSISVCTFWKGWFAETLPRFKEPCVLVFVDVDLRQSLKDCLCNLWPLLRPGCYFFSHEARDVNLMTTFFDSRWWTEKLGCTAPGFIGVGTGLALPNIDGFHSSLGYVVRY